MSAVKSKNTKIEQQLAKALWAAGLRYRKNDKTVYGKPDFCLKGLKIAIFCDGEFWHGKDWEVRKNDHKSNIDFWHKKIEANIARDKKVNEVLLNEGWIVMRFWGGEIKRNVAGCVEKIKAVVDERKNKGDQDN